VGAVFDHRVNFTLKEIAPMMVIGAKLFLVTIAIYHLVVVGNVARSAAGFDAS
jgi:hypothetical protein